MLPPVIETSKLIALQALLALLQPMRKLPTLKRLVQDQGNALTNLRQGDRRGPVFPPIGFQHQEPRGQSRERLLLLPPCPRPHLRVGPTGFALAPRETCFDAMFRFGHAGQLPEWGLRDGMGQIRVDFHDLVLIAVTGAKHHPQFLVTLLTPVGSGDHTPFDDLHHPGTFGTIAASDAPPGHGGKRLAPGLHAVPGTRGPASLPTLLW